MKETTAYQASDGKVFSTIEECRAHEARGELVDLVLAMPAITDDDDLPMHDIVRFMTMRRADFIRVLSKLD